VIGQRRNESLDTAGNGRNHLSQAAYTAPADEAGRELAFNARISCFRFFFWLAKTRCAVVPIDQEHQIGLQV
jgi:hypothetical protein